MSETPVLTEALATDSEVMDVMRNGGLELAERAYYKHYSNEYHLAPEQQQHHCRRWKYIMERIKELAKGEKQRARECK